VDDQIECRIAIHPQEPAVPSVDAPPAPAGLFVTRGEYKITGTGDKTAEPARQYLGLGAGQRHQRGASSRIGGPEQC
jgi:hypothetical protein